MLGSLAIADILADLTYFALNSVVYSVKLLNHTAVWAWLPAKITYLLSIPLQHISDTRLRINCFTDLAQGLRACMRITRDVRIPYYF